MREKTVRVRGWLRSHLTHVALAAVAGLAVSAALALATVPDSGGVIHTCYETESTPSGQIPKSGGPNWRVIDPAVGQSCDPASGLVPLNLNQQGPQGPAGATGPAGPSGVPSGQGSREDCPAVVGHLSLSGKPSLSSDLCAVAQVRIGGQTSVQGQLGATTEFELTRRTDGTSPKLLKATTQGTVFQSATIQVYKPGTTSVAATYKLSHATIGSFKAGLGLVHPIEVLTLVSVPKKGT